MKSDELYHWKYKSRHMGPSGKWVYEYDDGSASENGHESTIEQYRLTPNGNGMSSFKKETVTRKTDTSQLLTSRRTFTFSDGTMSTTVTYGKAHVMKMNLERKISQAASPETVNRGRQVAADLISKAALRARGATSSVKKRLGVH